MKQAGRADGQSADIVSGNIAKMKALFPEAFSGEGVNFETLRQLLGDASVLDEGGESYGLHWHGKKQARRLALTPSLGTLLPCPEESVAWATTRNLFIEGDNLEVLKLLQKSYAGKVKMIYIDPPYNTGKEFIYPDKFHENIETYLKATGQVDGAGLKFSSNPETGGRKHTNWLTMMYPRLLLARHLLRDDGVMFISIDDNEVNHLSLLCSELFGEENFIAALIWERAYAPKNDARFVSNSHDYVLMYCKSIDHFQIGRLPRTEDANARYKNPDNDPRGRWKSDNLTVKTYSEKYDYPVKTPGGREVNPTHGSCWRVSREKFQALVEDNRIWFGHDGNNVPSIKRFITELNCDGMTPTSILFYKEVGHSQEGRHELKALFDGKGYFDGPKPVRLLRRLLHLVNPGEEDIILDFFAGSGTTAHATMQLNAEDNARRTFIMVQLPELCTEKSAAFKDGYRTVAEIGKARIRRAGAKIKTDTPDYAGDTGFKVFKLAKSNIKVWNPDPADLEASLLAHEEPLVAGRSEQDILYELLLKRGVDLAVPIESRIVAGRPIHSIGNGRLFACLDKALISGLEQVEAIAAAIADWRDDLAPGDTQVFFRDSAFRDAVAKTNMVAILEQRGITHVRSL